MVNNVVVCNINTCPAAKVTIYNPDGSFICGDMCPILSNKVTNPDGSVMCKLIICPVPMVVSRMLTSNDLFCMDPFKCPQGFDPVQDPDQIWRCIAKPCPTGTIVQK